jgi:hypothetical protein
MFKIKSEQIRLFQPDAEAAFVVRVMDYLKENHADEVVHLPNSTVRVAELPDGILREMVRGGIIRAENHGIEWKSTLLSFVVLLFSAAPNFDRHPKARKFFSENATIDDAALESLMDAMTDEDWEALEKRYDPQAWTLPVNEGASV